MAARYQFYFGCGRNIVWYNLDMNSTEMKAYCGKTQTDVMGNPKERLCEACEAKGKREFPQGWETYPGDRCIHGVYVGGSMEDRICGECENPNT